MATTKAAKIVRSIVGDYAEVFNDKLEDGTRSFKVWNWAADPCCSDWETKAAAQLTAAGFKTKIVTTRGGAKRLHVV